MAKIEVGAQIRKIPNEHLYTEVGRPNDSPRCKERIGTIIDVNRAHRHFTVEYDFDGVKIRETYKMNVPKPISVGR